MCRKKYHGSESKEKEDFVSVLKRKGERREGDRNMIKQVEHGHDTGDGEVDRRDGASKEGRAQEEEQGGESQGKTTFC